MKNMKILTLLLILTTLAVHAQQSNKLTRISNLEIGKINAGSHFYVYDDNLNKFAGTWIGRENGKTVKILFFQKGFHLNNNDDNEIELMAGSFQYFENEKLIVNYELKGSASSKDTLNIFIDVKSRKAEAALLVIYLQDGTIKVEIEKNRFEFKNDKDFELKEPIILSKQN